MPPPHDRITELELQLAAIIASRREARRSRLAGVPPVEPPIDASIPALAPVSWEHPVTPGAASDADLPPADYAGPEGVREPTPKFIPYPSPFTPAAQASDPPQPAVPPIPKIDSSVLAVVRRLLRRFGVHRFE